jgi:hypothetical protein
MDACHVPAWSGGDDRGLKVIAYSSPDPGKGQRKSIRALEVERLTVAG